MKSKLEDSFKNLRFKGKLADNESLKKINNWTLPNSASTYDSAELLRSVDVLLETEIDRFKDILGSDNK